MKKRRRSEDLWLVIKERNKKEKTWKSLRKSGNSQDCLRAYNEYREVRKRVGIKKGTADFS